MFKIEKVKPWFYSLTHWFFIVFIGLSFVLKGKNQLRIVGFLWVSSLLVSYIRESNKTVLNIRNAPKELWSYTLWGTWAIFSGVLIVLNMEVFIKNVTRFIQIAICLWSLFVMLRIEKNIKVVFYAMITASIIQLIAIWLGFNYDIVDEIIVTDIDAEDHVRVTGLTSNSNALAGMMILGISCMTQFWYAKKGLLANLVTKSLIVGFTLVASSIVLQSGSRKAAIYLAFFLCGWIIWLLPIGKGVAGFMMRLLFILGILVFAGYMMTFVMEDTTVGLRFNELLNKGQGSFLAGAEQNIRADMYREGLKMFFTNPIAGVGLGQFIMYFYTGHYSHSDYIEPLACTGLIGFLIYHSFYWILLVRLFRLRSRIRCVEVKYQLGIMILTVICVQIWGIGSPQWDSPIIFLLLTSYAIHAWTLDRKMRGLEPMSEDERKQLFRGSGY